MITPVVIQVIFWILVAVIVIAALVQIANDSAVAGILTLDTRTALRPRLRGDPDGDLPDSRRRRRHPQREDRLSIAQRRWRRHRPRICPLVLLPLRTERLLLRSATLDDLDAWHALSVTQKKPGSERQARRLDRVRVPRSRSPAAHRRGHAAQPNVASRRVLEKCGMQVDRCPTHVYG